MAQLDARHRYMARVLALQYGMPVASCETVFEEEANAQTISDFFEADGVPSKLVFFKQSRDTVTEDGEVIEAPGATRTRPGSASVHDGALAVRRAFFCRGL
eukprot:6209514-Pleurochrysis_carterae.AAC.1